MLKRHLWMGAAVLMLSAGAVYADDHAFVGPDSCKMCHTAKTKGEQYTIWKASPHAKAFETLASDKAKELGKAKGVTDPQKDPKCLKCHVTGYGAPEAMHTQKWKQEDGVTCESCHGAGADYKKMDIMKDEAKAKAAGLIIPDEKVCKGCHNEESPSYKPFDFKTYFEKIKHPNPMKGKAAQ